MGVLVVNLLHINGVRVIKIISNLKSS
ncbi:unnamed protein product [Aspergillus niger]|uniref:Contig An13c0080, genomic contig n=1 Tax=Aspergillus niger (strain ATCC MYA-4892 / CBS 513.88 / FGSC A1513) TaxID=425011 RepID=A2R1Y9_ASPNC|nr:unnamed protein product [Aspergillus niger]